MHRSVMSTSPLFQQPSSESDLSSFINLNLAIVYLRMNRQPDLLRLVEVIEPESFHSQSVLNQPSCCTLCLVGFFVVATSCAPEGMPGISDVSPLSEISGLSCNSTFISALLFFCLVLLPLFAKGRPAILMSPPIWNLRAVTWVGVVPYERDFRSEFCCCFCCLSPA